MNRMYRGRPFRLVTISLDDAAKRDEALEVLKKNHVAATNYILKASDRDALADALDKEWPGPFPTPSSWRPGARSCTARSVRSILWRSAAPSSATWGEPTEQTFPEMGRIVDLALLPSG